ncbi:unnamed protein product [Pedinophyceae sp. YPF-701]|nr:unnamed protein product [Pedinophyceae sp. YPF-701]
MPQDPVLDGTIFERPASVAVGARRASGAAGANGGSPPVLHRPQAVRAGDVLGARSLPGRAGASATVRGAQGRGSPAADADGFAVPAALSPVDVLARKRRLASNSPATGAAGASNRHGAGGGAPPGGSRARSGALESRESVLASFHKLVRESPSPRCLRDASAVTGRPAAPPALPRRRPIGAVDAAPGDTPTTQRRPTAAPRTAPSPATVPTPAQPVDASPAARAPSRTPRRASDASCGRQAVYIKAWTLEVHPPRTDATSPRPDVAVRGTATTMFGDSDLGPFRSAPLRCRISRTSVQDVRGRVYFLLGGPDAADLVARFGAATGRRMAAAWANGFPENWEEVAEGAAGALGTRSGAGAPATPAQSSEPSSEEGGGVRGGPSVATWRRSAVTWPWTTGRRRRRAGSATATTTRSSARRRPRTGGVKRNPPWTKNRARHLRQARRGTLGASPRRRPRRSGNRWRGSLRRRPGGVRRVETGSWGA